MASLGPKLQVFKKNYDSYDSGWLCRQAGTWSIGIGHNPITMIVIFWYYILIYLDYIWRMPYAVCFVKPVSTSLDKVRFGHVWFSIFDKGPLNTPCMGTPSALVAGCFWPWLGVCAAVLRKWDTIQWSQSVHSHSYSGCCNGACSFPCGMRPRMKIYVKQVDSTLRFL